MVSQTGDHFISSSRAESQRTGATCSVTSGTESDERSETRDGISSSTFAASLRKECANMRKQSADEVMKLLASQHQTGQSGHKGPSAMQTRESNSSVSHGCSDVDGEGIENAGTVPRAQRPSDEQNTAAQSRGTCPGDGVAEQTIQMCVECEDQHAELECLTCDEPFCRPCWGSLHRRGRRAEHTTQAILGELMPAPVPASEPFVEPHSPPQSGTGDVPGEAESGAEHTRRLDDDSADHAHDAYEDEDDEHDRENEDLKKNKGKRQGKRRCVRGLAVGLNGSSVLEECRFIPLRLDERERGLLAMLSGALSVSEYTDRVDVLSRWSKAKTIKDELRLALGTLAGMMAAGDAKVGDKSSSLQDALEDNEAAFAEIFEVGRRFKVTNPEKFRNSYGKMMYMLQDAAQGRTGFRLVKEIQMVHGFVEQRSGLALLEDKRVLAATADVSGFSMSLEEIREKVRLKTKARAALLEDYASDTFLKRDIERVLDSIADANNYIAFNVAPVERMLELLRQNFHPDKPEEEWSLRLTGGRKRFSSSSLYSSGYGSFGSYGYGGGYGMFGSSTAMLSHDHRTQYTFVLQSLRLWSEAMRNMYRLWYFADSDLLSGRASYRLCNTGQGLNRVQSCPSVSSEMRRILGIVQSECGPWVGLSVVHLGDRDVPNALMFIDKYTQIPRILNPIGEVVRSLGEMALDPLLGQYVDVGWGGVRNAKMAVLSDFFKGGFDGSGDDGGSCIDGRLTSAWNWCSLLHKKAVAPIFSLAGQFSFDGGWGDGLTA